jgi:hypothetical protein
MNEEKPPPQEEIPSDLLLEDPHATVAEDNEEAVLNFFRRHGLWLALLTIVLIAFFGYGAYKKKKNQNYRQKATQRLEEALIGLHENPKGTRKALEDLLEDNNVKNSTLKSWMEFLIVRTYVEEEQRQFVENNVLPYGALKKIDDFIQTHKLPQLLAFAYLSKAVLLEDLGDFKKSQEILKKLNMQYADSIVTRFSKRILMPQTSQRRHQLWQDYLKKIKP